MLRPTITILGAWLLATAFPATAQQTTPATQTQPTPKVDCRHPADPHRRPQGCNSADFELEETLTGGWNELRHALKRIGLTSTASYVSALQTNATGGTHQVWSYAGQLSFAVSADLSEMIGTPGLSAYVGISWGTGSNLANTLNTPMLTSGLYAPSFYLGEMYLQQKLFNQKLTILAGRLAAANAFAALPVFTNYVTYGINPTPYALGENDITYFGPPTGTEWGAQASYTLSPSIQFATGVFNTNLNSANGLNHGADFTLQEGNKGVLAIGEIDYLHNHRATSTGMPGQIAVGFLHSSNAFPYLTNPLEASDGYSAVYVMGQQMVYQPDGPGTFRGATLWGAWTQNSKQLVSPVPLFWGTGFSYEGFLSTRRRDVFSVGVLRSKASQYATPNYTEDLIEANYQWAHSRFLTLTPHLQYSWKQGPGSRNATVVGIQLALTL